MANLAPATQGGDSQPLKKPADWAIHMVTAAIKFLSGNSTLASYTAPDDGRIDILNTLNWYEAHDEYEWPEFTNMGFNFSQAMRLRRALVNDVFVALQKAGSIKVSCGADVLGTPDDVDGTRGVKRAGTGVSRNLAERKRQCKRGDDSDTNVASDNGGKPFWDNEGLLAGTMRILFEGAGADVVNGLDGEKDARARADIIQKHFADVFAQNIFDHLRALDEAEETRWAEELAKDITATSRHSSPELSINFNAGRASHARSATMSVPVDQQTP